MHKPSLSRQIAIVTILAMVTIGCLIYLVTSAGLDAKGFLTVGFMTLLFYLLIKR
jgi:hypothetical protein